MKLKIVVQHGEGKTLFYVVDQNAPEAEQPAVLATCHTMPQAERALIALQGTF